MKLKIFSVFDSAAGAFLPPIFQATEALLIRELKKLPEQQPNHVMVKHAEHFTVFELGEFDDAQGKITQAMITALFNLKVFFSQGELQLAEVRSLHAEARERSASDPDLVMERDAS